MSGLQKDPMSNTKGYWDKVTIHAYLPRMPLTVCAHCVMSSSRPELQMCMNDVGMWRTGQPPGAFKCAFTY